MKKEFLNPTMRFSFFSRENIVTSSTVVDSSNETDAENGLAEFAGGSSNVSIKTVKLSDYTIGI